MSVASAIGSVASSIGSAISSAVGSVASALGLGGSSSSSSSSSGTTGLSGSSLGAALSSAGVSSGSSVGAALGGSSSGSGGTYNSSTGVFTSSSGVSQSMANAPSGATLVGGGGSTYTGGGTVAGMNMPAISSQPLQTPTPQPNSYNVNTQVYTDANGNQISTSTPPNGATLTQNSGYPVGMESGQISPITSTDLGIAAAGLYAIGAGLVAAGVGSFVTWSAGIITGLTAVAPEAVPAAQEYVTTAGEMASSGVEVVTTNSATLAEQSAPSIAAGETIEGEPPNTDVLKKAFDTVKNSLFTKIAPRGSIAGYIYAAIAAGVIYKSTSGHAADEKQITDLSNSALSTMRALNDAGKTAEANKLAQDISDLTDAVNSLSDYIPLVPTIGQSKLNDRMYAVQREINQANDGIQAIKDAADKQAVADKVFVNDINYKISTNDLNNVQVTDLIKAAKLDPTGSAAKFLYAHPELVGNPLPQTQQKETQQQQPNQKGGGDLITPVQSQDEVAEQEFGKKYAELTDEQKKYVDDIIANLNTSDTQQEGE